MNAHATTQSESSDGVRHRIPMRVEFDSRAGSSTPVQVDVDFDHLLGQSADARLIDPHSIVVKRQSPDGERTYPVQFLETLYYRNQGWVAWLVDDPHNGGDWSIEFALRAGNGDLAPAPHKPMIGVGDELHYNGERWQPIAEEEDTLAENLAEAGYQNGFVCTTQHCWNPGFNFHRGFWQWHFERGFSGEDRWRSPFGVPKEALRPYGDPDELLKNPHRGTPMTLANRGLKMVDAETATARAFKWAGDFLEDNRDQPFYLQIDSFAPHEPWEAPEKYSAMYADPNYKGLRYQGAFYGPADRYSKDEIAYIKAQYSGLVTHVDHWFGDFMRRLDTLGLADNTAILFISDHGTNFCENPRNVIGKPENAMYPGVMHLPFLVRMPNEESAGTVRDDLVSNLDLPATVYDLANITSHGGIDGQSVLPLIKGFADWSRRDWVTCRYANSLCYIDDSTWALGDVGGTALEVFDLNSDPGCRSALSGQEAADRWKGAWKGLLSDAGGRFPDYRHADTTDALGRKK